MGGGKGLSREEEAQRGGEVKADEAGWCSVQVEEGLKAFAPANLTASPCVVFWLPLSIGGCGWAQGEGGA